MSMRDITGKHTTFRTATATAVLSVGEKGRECLEQEEVPKGDPFEIVRTAAVSGSKKTADLIPHCHNIPVENCDIDFELTGDGLSITVTVSAVARTGMEMEAMTAASVASLTMYDILKPVEDDVEIDSIRLDEKKGGKSQYRDRFQFKDLVAAVLVISDGVHEGTREDRSGKILKEKLGEFGFDVQDYSVVPDEQDQIREQLASYCENGVDFVATTGGTGPAPRDVTAEATREVIDREIPGIAEAMRTYGQARTPYAMFSRGITGQRGKTLIVNFPGSSAGTREGLEAIFPGLKHFFKMREKGSGGH